MVAYLCTEVCDLLSGLDTLLGGSGGGSLGGGAINLCKVMTIHEVLCGIDIIKCK